MNVATGPHVVAGWWDRISAVAPAPAPELVAAMAVVAMAATAVPQVWRHTRHLVTLAHEGTHGVAALLSGRRLAGIRLHSDTSGLTVSRGRSTGPGMVLTAASGYVGPGLIGLLAAVGLSRGHAVGVLWAILVALALLLVQIRNVFGFVPVLVSGLLLAGVTRWASEPVQSLIAYGVTWFLLLAAPRAVVELARTRRRLRGPDRASDAAALARLTGVPALLWVGGFLLLTLGCLAAGGWLLVAPAVH